RRAVPAFRSARWFISKHAHAFELIAWHFIRDGLQRAGVESAGHTVTSIRTAVQERFEMHRRNRAVFFHAGLDSHQDRMTAAMTIENFFAGQRAFHRTTSNHSQLADDHLVIEGIALATKTATVRSGDHANVTRRNFENFG